MVEIRGPACARACRRVCCRGRAWAPWVARLKHFSGSGPGARLQRDTAACSLFVPTYLYAYITTYVYIRSRLWRTSVSAGIFLAWWGTVHEFRLSVFFNNFIPTWIPIYKWADIQKLILNINEYHRLIILNNLFRHKFYNVLYYTRDFY